ncbi:MAG: hypothetical protein LBQ91_06410, partial [Oscillospiraceae bacterium]|nr:hypothetical protein [Oscillospiraceae bacterium]
MIAQMKKLTAVVPAKKRAGLLRGLSRLRAVQLRQPQFEDDTAEKTALRAPQVRETPEDARVFARAVEIITKHRTGKAKGGFFTPLPEVSIEEFFERRDGQYELYLEYAREIVRQDTRLRYLLAETGRLDAEIASLEPWAASAVPLQFAGTKTTKAARFTCPASVTLTALEEAAADATALAQLTEISSGEELRYLVLIAQTQVFDEAAAAIKALSCSEAHFRDTTGTASENIRILRDKKADGISEANFIASRLEYEAKHLDELRLFADISATEEALLRSENELYETEATAVVYAWYEAEYEEQIREVLVSRGAAYAFETISEEEFPEVPVKLKSGGLARPLNMVTDMYALPVYGTIDPNPLMLPFFVLFYGMMMADMAYGIIMFILGQLVLSKKKPDSGMYNFFGLMRLCGVTTFIFGVVTGSFFGDAIFKYAELLNPETTFTAFPWPTFDMLKGNNTLMVLIAAMGLGVVQIVTGMAIKFVQT